jgi:hypothetical protein
MAARLLIVGVVAIVTGGSQYSCSSGDPTLLPPRKISSGDGPTFTTSLALQDAAGVEKTRFQRGEVITLQLTVRNRTDHGVELDFASGQQYDFFVFDSGSNDVRWLWSAAALFTQGSSTLTFAGGEARVFSVDFAQDLPRGAYEARGAVLFDELHANPLAPHELGSTLRDFVID